MRRYPLDDYDFLSEPTWSDGVDHVVRSWGENRDFQQHSGRFELLFDEQGAPQTDRIQQLLQNRDNRPVTIKE